MGSATKHVSTTRRHAYTMLAPACHVEILKAINWASQDFQDEHGRPVQYDDDLMVEGDGEHVTVYFEVSGDKQATPSEVQRGTNS